jgi:hypothetical protein
VFPRQLFALGVCAVSLPAQQAMIFKVPLYWGGFHASKIMKYFPINQNKEIKRERRSFFVLSLLYVFV